MTPPRARHLSLSAALVGLLFAVACASPEERLAEHMARADEYIGKDKPREALIELRPGLCIKSSFERIVVDAEPLQKNLIELRFQALHR